VAVAVVQVEDALNQNLRDVDDEKSGTEHLGSMLGFLKIFSPKNSAKNLAFLTQNKA
jgi:hypothetical protein